MFNLNNALGFAFPVALICSQIYAFDQIYFFWKMHHQSYGVTYTFRSFIIYTIVP